MPIAWTIKAQLDRGFSERASQRFHCGIRAQPAERLEEERRKGRPLAERLPPSAIRRVICVSQQPYLRFDTNDYSLDPRFAGRRVEVRFGQQEIAAPGP